MTLRHVERVASEIDSDSSSVQSQPAVGASMNGEDPTNPVHHGAGHAEVHPSLIEIETAFQRPRQVKDDYLGIIQFTSPILLHRKKYN